MKKITTKFMISIIALVFGFVAIGSTTLAWFSLTKDASIAPIQTTIRGGVGIELRLKTDNDDDPWGVGYIDLNSNSYFYNNYIKNVAFSPVTYQPTSPSELFRKALQEGKEFKYFDALANKDYIQFTLQFRATKTNGASSAIKLGVDSNMLSNGDKDEGSSDWIPTVSYNITEGVIAPDVMRASCANVARIMFKDLTIVGSETLTIWENPANQLTGNTLGLNSKDDTFGAVDYLKNKLHIPALSTSPTFIDSGYGNDFETNVIGSEGAIIEQLIPGSGTDPDSDVSNLYGENPNYFYGEVEVTIWMEGWDKECLDAIISNQLLVNLMFSYSD